MPNLFRVACVREVLRRRIGGHPEFFARPADSVAQAFPALLADGRHDTPSHLSRLPLAAPGTNHPPPRRAIGNLPAVPAELAVGRAFAATVTALAIGSWTKNNHKRGVRAAVQNDSRETERIRQLHLTPRYKQCLRAGRAR